MTRRLPLPSLPGARRAVASRPLSQSSSPPIRNFLRFLDAGNHVRFGEASAVDRELTVGTRVRLLSGSPFSGFKRLDQWETIQKFLPPVLPSSLFCVGLNYQSHIKEVGLPSPLYPAIMGKNANSVSSHEGEIIIPRVCDSKPEVDFEGELAIVIGKPCKDVSVEAAEDYILGSPSRPLPSLLGYTVANDVSARRWQNPKVQSQQWTRSKSFDTFTPLGPLVQFTTSESLSRKEIRTTVNGQVMQKCLLNDMKWNSKEIVSFLSQDTTLLPGTVICTGSPPGVGYVRKPPVYLKPGDEVRVSIEDMGTLCSHVVAKREGDGPIRNV